MSKRINVNPDHYKVAGRERQGENIVHSVERRVFAAEQADADRWQARQEQQRPSWTHPTQPLAETKPARAKSRRTAAARKTKPAGRRSPAKRAQPARKQAAKKRPAASTARPRGARRARRRS